MAEINIEGQIAFSFAVGILTSPYIYGIVWIILFLIVYEIAYFVAFRIWPIRIRLGILVAYILGLLVGIYALKIEGPGMF